MKNCPFEALGITPAASEDEVRAAYRKMAALLHPDAGGDPDKFHELTVTRDLALSRVDRACPDCNGDGVRRSGRGFSKLISTCRTCGGTGER